MKDERDSQKPELPFSLTPRARVHALSSWMLLLAGAFIIFFPVSVMASQAYGSINNFDVVNDTGVPCHGFEIELDDITSAQITYTYDYNHYSTPIISTDFTDPIHPKTFIRYEAKYNNGGWSAYTAVPTNAISPTAGHQFTDPSVNFGGEHFGVGYSANPTNILYYWMQDDGAGNLKIGPAVSVSTPIFNYIAPVGAAPPQIQPVIVPPPLPIVYEFGPATWVKMITTTSHTNTEVHLRDLVSIDANYPGVKGWANGEPAEVETEWQVLQTDSGNTNGGNNILQGVAQNLNQGDDVVTTRYEFYQYPTNDPTLFDPETYEALAQTVGVDGIHGVASTNGGPDFSTTVIVGKFLGAQMSAAAITNPVGLIDHLQDGEVGLPYPDRTVIIGGGTPFTASFTGSLPQGMTLNTNSADPNCGVLSGMPAAGGSFQFDVSASDAIHPAVSKTYILKIAAAGANFPPHAMVSASATPPGSGTFIGTGDFPMNQNTTVIAQAKPGYAFSGWSEAGVPLTNATHYTLTVNANHDLTGTFTNTGPATNPQTITFSVPSPVKFSTNTITLVATASSGLPVSYALISGHATLSNSILTLTGVGVVKVTASQSGGWPYKPAAPVTASIVVAKGSPTITFNPATPVSFVRNGSLVLTATDSAGLPVKFTSSNPKILSITGTTATMKSKGTVRITASQAATLNYSPANPVTKTITLN